MTAYSAEAQRRHVNEALAVLRSWGQRRSNAWQIVVRIWVENR